MEGPKGGGARRVGGPKGGGPEGWGARRVGGPKGGRFFPCPAAKFVLFFPLWVSSRGMVRTLPCAMPESTHGWETEFFFFLTGIWLKESSHKKSNVNASSAQ